MKHWRRSNPQKAPLKHSHKTGIVLALEELLECKRLADSLVLPTRQKVKTHLLGGFISHFKGRGMDFDEARPYPQGDDIRSIDWRVTARTGDAHTKIYREERERPVFVLLDQSAAMMFGSRQQFKSVQAAKLASVIMWKTLDDGNRFGALLFDEYNHFEYKPASSRKNCLRILNQIVQSHNAQINRIYNQSTQSASPVPSLANTLYRTRHVARPGSLIFILSDFRQLDETAEHHLLRLGQHSDINLLHVTDPIEQELPPPGHYTITDGKRRMTLDTRSKNTRHRFHDDFVKHSEYMKDFCTRNRLRWNQVNTTDNLNQLLLNPSQGSKS